MKVWNSNNPSGIVINPGYYALAEAIMTDNDVYEILRRWCGCVDPLPDPLPILRKRTGIKGAIKRETCIAIYKKNPQMPAKEIAQIVGCTPETVCAAIRSIRRKK